MSHDFFKDEQDVPEYMQEEKPVSTSDMHENETKVDLFAMEEEPKEEIKAEEPVSEVIEETKEQIEDNIKRLAAIYGEEELNIPAEAIFKHKVDGEEVEVNLQDLLNNYSGKQSWDKKFSELDQDKNTYKNDLDMVNKYINEFASISKEDPVAGFEFLAKFAGADPLQFRRQLRDQVMQKYSPYLNMSEEERRLNDLQEENEYFKKSRESDMQRQMQQQATLELENQFKQVQETHNISDERRQELSNDLMKYGKVERVQPEDLLQLHQAYEIQDRAFEALEAVNPELIKDESKLITVESLLKGNPQLSKDDLQNHVAKLWGSDVEKAVANLKPRIEKKVVEEPKQEYQPKILSTGKVDFFS